MAIIRSARASSNFSSYSNEIIYDPRLSMRELGLLVRLLARPDNWETNSETLAREFNCGREQMRAVLTELREHGYVRLVKFQDPATGFWSSNWMVFDKPEPEEPKAEEPAPGNRVLGLPDAITKTDYQRPITTTEKKKPRASLADDGGENFKTFWSAYPKKAGKDAARKAFAKRKFDEQAFEKVMAALNEQKASEQWQKDGGQFIPHPATWLNQGRFEDEIGSAAAPTPGGIGNFV